jgi:hypothetical protein
MATTLPPLEPIIQGYSVEIEASSELIYLVHLCCNGERKYLLGHESARPAAEQLQFALSGLCEYVNAGGDPQMLLGWAGQLLQFAAKLPIGTLIHFQGETAVSRIHAEADGRFLRVEPDFSEYMTEGELLAYLEETEEKESEEGDDETEDVE